MFEKDMKVSLLMDTYGVLLSERKRSLLDMYYEEDLSLAEIADITGISRQGVRDSIKKSVNELHEFEEKLMFVSRSQEIEAKCGQIRELVSAGKDAGQLTEADRKILSLTDEIISL